MVTSTAIELASQQFVEQDPTHAASDVSVSLISQLTAHYESVGMFDRQPAKAQFLVERGHRSAAWAGMWHVVTSQMIRNALPNLRQYDSLDDLPICEGSTEFHDFAAAGSWALATASEAVLTADPSHEWYGYRPLWQIITDSQDAYRHSWIAWKEELGRNAAVVPPNPPVEPGPASAMSDIWLGSAYEISKSALWALVNYRVASRTNEDHSPASLSARALAGAARMNWATTMKRATNLELFPKLFEEMPDDVTADFFAPANGSVFLPQAETGVCQWSHGSLKTGPWRSPGVCAGRVWCEPAFEQDKVNCLEYFGYAESAAGTEIPRPSQYMYNGGLAMLVYGAFIAKRTIYNAG